MLPFQICTCPQWVVPDADPEMRIHQQVADEGMLLGTSWTGHQGGDTRRAQPSPDLTGSSGGHISAKQLSSRRPGTISHWLQGHLGGVCKPRVLLALQEVVEVTLKSVQAAF